MSGEGRAGNSRGGGVGESSWLRSATFNAVSIPTLRMARNLLSDTIRSMVVM
jgi:hypothetical protein